MHLLNTSLEKVYFDYCKNDEHRDKEYTYEDFGEMLDNRKKQLKELQQSFIAEIKTNLLTIPNKELYLKRILLEANQIKNSATEVAQLLFKGGITFFLKNGNKANLANDVYAWYFIENTGTLDNLIGTLTAYLELEGGAQQPLQKLSPGLPQRKLKWDGTPGEFGAIFDLLLDNGFIKVIRDKKNMITLLHEIFDIKNENGEIINAGYLYKCFKDKQRNYTPGQLKMPFSDNYHKGK